MKSSIFLGFQLLLTPTNACLRMFYLFKLDNRNTMFFKVNNKDTKTTSRMTPE